jgi:hypothetical protein
MHDEREPVKQLGCKRSYTLRTIFHFKKRERQGQSSINPHTLSPVKATLASFKGNGMGNELSHGDMEKGLI